MKDRLEHWLRLYPKTAVLVSSLLALVGLTWIIGPFLWSPNSHMYTFGGDGLVLYYDAAYHIFHGKQGVMLDAMLHPKEELIFLTDAQGAWVVVWQWFSRNVADLSAYVQGLVHTTNNIGIILAVPFLYRILTRLGASSVVALFFSPLIVLLSPQMLRLGGHFGLAYPFVIPMTIWWLLRERKRVDWKDVFVFFTLLFFTFNNPYVGFSAGLALLIYAGLYAALNVKNLLKSSEVLIPAIGTVLALVLPYITFKILDPFTDRIVLQWGVFNFRTTLSGSFFPDNTLAAKLFRVNPGVEFESIQYLGVVSMLAVLIGIVALVIRKVKKNRASETQLSDPRQKWILYSVSSVLVYLFCYQWNFSPRTEAFLEESAGFLLMFKAVPRLAWPFYFAFSISGILFVSKFFDWLRVRNVIGAYAVLALVFLVNSVDVAYFHRSRYTAHDKHYELSRFDALRADMNTQGVAATDYQAILSVPRQLAWCGNVFTDWKWGTHFGSTNASLALGLPMINANLGRAPVGPLMDVTQLMSTPEIDRSVLLDALPNDKPILLIQAKSDTMLSDGERFLISLADTVFSDRLMYSYRLEVDALRKASGTMARDDKRPGNSNLSVSPREKVGYAYQTSMASSRILSDSLTGHFTGFVKASTARHGQGMVEVSIYNSADSVRYAEWIEVRRLPDASNGWYYVSKDYPMEQGDSLAVKFKAPQEIEIDQFKLELTKRTYEVLVD
ncbi:MAG: hypothetical protein AB8F78_10310 [Saprospiraceae bacterium]